MTTMDNTVVFTALPTIMADLDMSSSAKDWVATGYILMFSCLMIMGGRLADVYGCRVTFTSGMVVFTAASAVCGLAQSSDVLILARIVQGAGAALVLPATQVMVTVGRTDKQRSIGNIAFIGAASSATALGPTIGGVIVQHWHWGWIFLINILPGILVIVLGLFVLTSHGENKHARIDLPGVLISATMLFAFIYGLESGNKYGWSNPSVLSVFALGAIALVCFILVESWAPDPMIDLRFFRNRVFTGGLMSQMLYGIGFNGMMFYSQPFLQRFLGFSPPEAGLVMLPPAIAIMLLTPVAFLLATKIGPRPAIGAGMALMGLGMFLFSTLQTGDGYAQLMPGVMLVGVGAALGMPLVMYVLKAVPERRAGVASGVINVIREASGAFGIAIIGLLIHAVPDQGASAAELETFRDGTSSGLILGAGLVLIGGVISALTLPSRRGWLGPKHGKKPPLITEPGPRETLPDPIPVTPLGAPVGLAVVSAAPPIAPVPLPTTWEDEDMPDDRAPTPGPHWWTDTDTDTDPEAKPDDDTFTWQKDTGPPTPWPAPPSEPPPGPANAWEDWPAAPPTDSAQRITAPIPTIAPPRTAATWKDTPALPDDATEPDPTQTRRTPIPGQTTESPDSEPGPPGTTEAPLAELTPSHQPEDARDPSTPTETLADGALTAPHPSTPHPSTGPTPQEPPTRHPVQTPTSLAPPHTENTPRPPRRTVESPPTDPLHNTTEAGFAPAPVPPPTDSHIPPPTANTPQRPTEDTGALSATAHPTTEDIPTKDTGAQPSDHQTEPATGVGERQSDGVRTPPAPTQATTTDNTGPQLRGHRTEPAERAGGRPGDGVRTPPASTRATPTADTDAQPSDHQVEPAADVGGPPGDGLRTPLIPTQATTEDTSGQPREQHVEPAAVAGERLSDDVRTPLVPTHATTEDTSGQPREQHVEPAAVVGERLSDDVRTPPVPAQPTTTEDAGLQPSGHRVEPAAGDGGQLGDGVRTLRVTARASSVEEGGALVGRASGSGAGSADEVVGGDGAAGPSAEEDGGRPAPPEGWYEPYVPEEGPVDEPQPKPRSDAW